MTHLELDISPFASWKPGTGIITYTLALRGYGRHIALYKPGLSEESQRKRLRFAEEHRDQTIEQQFSILWSDETWVNGYYRKIQVTRRAGEEYKDTCLFSKQQRRSGWMFWGCFSSYKKGPCLFWEKSWKTINSERYYEHILPLVEQHITLHPYLVSSTPYTPYLANKIQSFMQDNAPSHASKFTKKWLQDYYIEVIIWPPNSPDLNPIEVVWDWMKQQIQETYGIEIDSVESQGKKMKHTRLKEIIQQAWNETVIEERLKELVSTMEQ